MFLDTLSVVVNYRKFPHHDKVVLVGVYLDGALFEKFEVGCYVFKKWIWMLVLPTTHISRFELVDFRYTFG